LSFQGEAERKKREGSLTTEGKGGKKKKNPWLTIVRLEEGKPRHQEKVSQKVGEPPKKKRRKGGKYTASKKLKESFHKAGKVLQKKRL